jgi:sugar (pentulose or hexulose) kinase
LGLDIGTTNTKAVLLAVAAEVTVLAVADAPTPSPQGLPGVIAGLVAEVTAKCPAARIGAVGIASMAETGVPLDDAGQPIGDWLGWNAGLAGPQAKALAAELSADSVFAATGTRLSAKVPLAVWKWLAENDAERWRALRHWAGVADYAAFVLTGELYTDHTLAGRTAAYRLPGGTGVTADIASAGCTTVDQLPESGEVANVEFAARFDAGLLAAAGLKAEQLPQVSHPGQRIVAQTLPAWEALGIPAGVPVLVAGHDHAVGAWAAGVREKGQAADSLGTAEAVYTIVADREVVDPTRLRAQGMSLVSTLDGDFALLAGHSAAGAMVEWWLEHHAAQLDAAQLGALAASARPDPSLLVLPYPFGRNAPAPDPDARVRLIGSQPWHGTAEKAAAVFAGLAMHAAWMLRVQSELGGVTPDVTLLGGPGLANPAWIAAKLRYTPGLRRAVEIAEPVACGAALFALTATGQARGALPNKALLAADPASPSKLSSPTSLPVVETTSEQNSAHAAMSHPSNELEAFIRAATTPE